MPTTLAPPRSRPPAGEALPELVHGQPISRADFYRITERDPDHYRHIERLDGKVYVNACSVRREGHSKPQSRIVGLLLAYEADTPGVEVGDNGTTQIEDDHDPQPDAYLLILPECGGQVAFTDDDYIRGAPELIVEVAGTTVRKDLGRLKEIYESDGCREYLVWCTDAGRFVCFRNGPGGFAEVPLDDGVFRSETFPGLWVDAAALLRGDLPAAMETLREGVATADHAAFAKRLAAAKAAG